MRSTMAVVTSTGAWRPGTAAVVITTSDGGHLVADQLTLAGQELLGLLPGVAARALLGLELELHEVGAERLHLLLGGGAHVVGRAPGRPRRRAVAMACRPATPAPEHEHLGGRDGAGRGHEHREELGEPHRRAARADRYPDTVACDDRASMDWARLMRGTRSRLKAVALRATRARTVSSCDAGLEEAHHGDALGEQLDTSSGVGAWTLATRSAPDTVSADTGRHAWRPLST